MPGQFPLSIKAVASAAPGTGNFTPGNASPGGMVWQGTLYNGWSGLVRFEDGAAWELCYCGFNGTLIQRSAAGFIASSSGSPLNLSANATAFPVVDGMELAPHLAGVPYVGWKAIVNAATMTAWGIGAPGFTGTAAAAAQANTNYLTAQPRVQITSAATANAQAGMAVGTVLAMRSDLAGMGGFEYTSRFGASAIPATNRLFMGLTNTTIIANTGNPSALAGNFAILGKDSTDTTMQFMVNSGSGTATKINTGMTMAVNGWYEVTIWSEPGSSAVYMLLVRLDTFEVFYGVTYTKVPTSGVMMLPQAFMGLSAAATAGVLHIGSLYVRCGA